MRWLLTEQAAGDVVEIRSQLGTGYPEDVTRLRQFLCDYFSGNGGCASKQGKSISPIGSACGSGKLLKVRWMIPGGGKSGGLRLAVVAFCDRSTVVLCRGWIRKDDPDDGDFEEAGRLADLIDSIDT